MHTYLPGQRREGVFEAIRRKDDIIGTAEGKMSEMGV
jgi:hypothetical protein